MKKRLILFVMALLLFPSIVKAASANIKISAPSSVYVGDTVKVSVTISSSDSLGSWQYSVAYDSAKLGDSSESQMVASYADNSGKKSVVNTWTFKAKTAGNVTFSIPSIVVYAFDDDSEMSLNGSKSISLEVKNPNNVSGGGSSGSNNTKPSSDYKYSDNNNLSSLVVEGFDFEFDKNKTDYSISVPNDTKSVKIGATAEDGKARVNGIGDFEVKEGDNLASIIVTAENGVKKTYNLNIIVIEKKPIEVMIDNVTYNVVRKKELLPDTIATYKESTTLIKGEEVPCYHSEITDFYLVGLRNNEGEIDLYRYDVNEDKFYPYNQLQLGGIYIALLDGETPDGYKKGKVKINDKDYDAFLKEGSYPLLFGINLESGERNYYSYDNFENTIQKLLQNASTNAISKKSTILIYGLIVLCVSEFIMLIISSTSKNKKLKKALKNNEYKDNKNYNDNIDNTTNDVEEQNIDSTADENLGYTAYVSDSVNNVFSTTKNEKKISKKKKQSDDEDMFQF